MTKSSICFGCKLFFILVRWPKYRRRDHCMTSLLEKISSLLRRNSDDNLCSRLVLHVHLIMALSVLVIQDRSVVFNAFISQPYSKTLSMHEFYIKRHIFKDFLLFSFLLSFFPCGSCSTSNYNTPLDYTQTSPR